MPFSLAGQLCSLFKSPAELVAFLLIQMIFYQLVDVESLGSAAGDALVVLVGL